MMVIMPSGTFACLSGKCGLYFWGAHDSIWHLAVVSVSFGQFPFLAPTFSGATLQGYNLLLDYFIYLISKIGISPLLTYFKLLPLVWFALFTTAGIALGKKIKDSPLFVGIFLFFLYFGSSFGYLLTLYHSHTLQGSSGALAMQSGLMMTNLQLAFSFVIILYQLLIIKSNKNSFKITLLMAILTALNMGLKFYGGMMSIFLSFFYLLIAFKFTKKQIINFILHGLIVALLTFVAVVVTYGWESIFSRANETLIFSPFSMTHSMIEDSSMFYLKDMVDARYYLYAVNPRSPRLFAIEGLTVLLFIVFNLGSRFVGVFYYAWKNLIGKKDKFEIYILTGMVFAFTLTILFIQHGIWWNVIQFSYYAIFFANIFASLLVFQLFKSKKLFLVIFGLIILILTIPPNLDIVSGSLSKNYTYISSEELDALKYLKGLPNGVVFESFHYASKGKLDDFLADTSFIPAFTGKISYVNDIAQMKLTLLDFENRYERVKKIDCKIFDQVNYVYIKKIYTKNILTRCIYKNDNFERVFKNREVSIYLNKMR